MAVRVKFAKDFEDEVQREKYLQEIEKVATTDQLSKIVKVASNKEMVAMLDSLEI